MEFQITLTDEQESNIVAHSLKDYYDVVDCDVAKMAINIVLEHYLAWDEFKEWREEVR